ncbi:MAG: GldG family protein, partial [Gammaproteobacteria bacterium]|nr:GldG family protein [Gammaproteobacteria bacterium]
MVTLSVTSALLWLSSRYDFVYDMTHNNMRSLSTASIALLNQIDGPLSVTAYAREDPQLRDAIRQFISSYQAAKPDLILGFINIDASPDEARQLGIRVNGELVLEYQDRTEHVRYADEKTFINAMARVSQDKQNWIAYLTGHGERDMLGRANHDLGLFGARLRDRGYNIQPVNLSEVPDIPDNTSVLVIAGPQVPLLEHETNTLLAYLHRGGSLFWLVDPGDLEFITEDLGKFLELNIAQGTVIDTASELLGTDDPTISVITNSLYTPHPLLTNFSYTTIYPHAAAILPGDSDVWISSPLFMTGNQAWVETSS